MNPLPTHATRAAAILALVCAVSAPAHAQSDREDQARRLFEEGTQLLDQGDYSGALATYRAAYEIAPRANIALNIGAVLLELGEDAAAANQFAMYLEMPDRDPKREARVAKELARLDASLGRVIVEVDAADAAVELDGEPIGIGPLEQTIRVDPGAHRVHVVHDERELDRERRFEIAAGEQQRITVDFPAPDQDTPSTGSATDADAAGDAPAVRATAPKPERTRRLGAFVRTDVDIERQGAVVVPGAVVRATERFHVFGAGLLGRDRGFEIGGRAWLTRGASLRALATVAAPVFFVDGPRPGGRASLGAAWIATSRIWVTVEIGAAYAPSVPDGFSSSAALASVAVELGL